MSFAATWSPDDSMLGEIRQVQRNEGYMVFLKCRRKNKRVGLEAELKSSMPRSGQGGGAVIIPRTAGYVLHVFGNMPNLVVVRVHGSNQSQQSEDGRIPGVS